MSYVTLCLKRCIRNVRLNLNGPGRQKVVTVRARSCVKVEVAVAGLPSLISLRFLWT